MTYRITAWRATPQPPVVFTNIETFVWARDEKTLVVTKKGVAHYILIEKFTTITIEDLDSENEAHDTP